MKENLEFLTAWTTMVLFALVGYRRRKAVWTKGSWRRFSALVILLMLLIAMAMVMASAVDSGFKATLPQWTWEPYTWITLTLATVCPMTLVGLLAWFAMASPDQQLEFKRRLPP
jgi:glucan phosphoethanolaminetransferase (alkaline phosphatase superfamily)